MNTLIKKALNIILCVLILVTTGLSNVVFAAENVGSCEESCNHNHEIEYCEGQDITWEKEVVVEVNSEEDFLNYPKNPNYKYTFIIESPAKTRAVCYMCGRPNMGTVTYKTQHSAVAKMCPSNNWGNDIFMSWNNYTYERCTACSYRSEAWLSQVTYTAQCLNGDTDLYGADWVVKYEYTQSAGYNPHQSLRWWTEYSYI